MNFGILQTHGKLKSIMKGLKQWRRHQNKRVASYQTLKKQTPKKNQNFY